MSVVYDSANAHVIDKLVPITLITIRRTGLSNLRKTWSRSRNTSTQTRSPLDLQLSKTNVKLFHVNH